MAWTAPNTYVAGAVLTAAQMNAMQANALAGGPIYATEALRDAAITAPFEGQRAYITGSTVAAAASSGGGSAVPTGIQTIYNGAAWVCVTPVGSLSNTSGTTTTALPTYVTTLTGDATAVSVTLSTGTSARIDLSGTMSHSGALSTQMVLSVSVSGATTVAVTQNNGCSINSCGVGYAQTLARSFIITGLTAGANTFTLNYGAQAGTQTWASRNITVQGIA